MIDTILYALGTIGFVTYKANRSPLFSFVSDTNLAPSIFRIPVNINHAHEFLDKRIFWFHDSIFFSTLSIE